MVSTDLPVLINVDQAIRSTSGISPCKNRGKSEYAGMMELADMQDLGSCAAMRWGSNPHARTMAPVQF